MAATFHKELMSVLNNYPFDTQRALSLSDQIHEAEVNGYEVSFIEEHLWSRLTARIEGAKRRRP